MMSKPLLLALLVSISFNLLFGYLSYNFHSDKAVAEAKLENCQKANKSLEESYEKQEKLCKLSDGIISEYNKEKESFSKGTDDLLEKLDKLHKAPLVKSEVVNETPSNVLDSKLPDDVRVLTESACNRVQGKACSTP